MAPIKCTPKIQTWELGQTVDAFTVRVYNDKLPSRMVPKRTSHTPKKFEDFVEALFDLIEAEIDSATETDETQKDAIAEDSDRTAKDYLPVLPPTSLSPKSLV